MSSIIQTINNTWLTIAAPQVVKRDIDKPSEEEIKAYKFGEIIEKLKAWQAEGKLICLFLGRTPLEKLPSHYGEAKPNEIWVCGDRSQISSENQDEQKLLDPSEQNIHFWMDFNHQESVELIRGLFNKVVIDGSTAHQLSNDFANRLRVILYPSDNRFPESEIIFLNPCRGYSLSLSSPTPPSNQGIEFSLWRYNIEITLETFSKQMKTLPEEHYTRFVKEHTEAEIQLEKKEYQKTFRGNPENNPQFDKNFKVYLADKNNQGLAAWACRLGAELLKAHLEGIYATVEEHKNAHYPYYTRYTSRKGERLDHYFVVQNPRNRLGAI